MKPWEKGSSPAGLGINLAARRFSAVGAFNAVAEKVVAITSPKGLQWGLTLVFEALAKVTPPNENRPLKEAFGAWTRKIASMPRKKWSNGRPVKIGMRNGFTACAWPRCRTCPTVVVAGDPLAFCDSHAARQAEHAEYFDHLRYVKREAKLIRAQDVAAGQSVT